MPMERKKEKQKTPAELASEATGSKPGSDAAEKKKAKPAKTESDKAKTEKKAAPSAKKKTTTPRRQRSRRPSPAPATQRRAPARPLVRAQAKYVRSSARKARLVIEHIRGKSIEDARAVLRHTPRGVARDLEKLLASAVANAENNHELVGDDLVIKECYADEGPTIKRFRPRAQGRATRIRKRTSHLTLTLTPKE
jgi:ribosomal protein L22